MARCDRGEGEGGERGVQARDNKTGQDDRITGPSAESASTTLSLSPDIRQPGRVTPPLSPSEQGEFQCRRGIGGHQGISFSAHRRLCLLAPWKDNPCASD